MLNAEPQNPGTPKATTIPQDPAPAPPAPATDPTELQALTAKRSELAVQLETVTDRREELAEQLQEANMAARPGLQERIRILDDRAARLEQEILLADDAIATSLASGVGVEQTITIPSSETPSVTREEMASAMVGEALVFVLLGIWLYRRTRRRAREQFSRGTPADAQRMDQLQNAVDAIAVEVERISEGQRYVSKMLNEGAQQPVAIGLREAEEALARRKAP